MTFYVNVLFVGGSDTRSVVHGSKTVHCFLNGISNESENFWVRVSQNASFTELATYPLDCLTTPISNAVVERILSMMSSIKTKSRNRIELKLLDAIVRIRFELLLEAGMWKRLFFKRFRFHT